MKSSIVFTKESPFSIELKQRVQSMLSRDSNGRFANTEIWIKAALLMIICACLYSTILFSVLRFIDRTLLILVFSFFTLILGLNVMHEAAHGNYSKNPFINRLLAYTFDVYGISSDLYNIKHIHFHHNYTNIFGHDGDISEAPVIRMSTQHPKKDFHRFQVFYTPLLYSLITVVWPLKDLGRLIHLKVATQSFRRPKPRVMMRIVFFKLISFLLTYILPIHLFGWKQALFFIFLFHLSLGSILTLIFQVAHVHSDSSFQESAPDSDWLTHQLKTSADFGTDSKMTNFLMGGLNFQVIHHMFPNTSYRHYPQIQIILKELCQKHQLPYYHFDHLGTATIAHFKWLHQLGTQNTH